MSSKNYNSYINDIKSKLTSLETSITEVHSLADDSHKSKVEGIMSDIQNIKNTLDEINWISRFSVY